MVWSLIAIVLILANLVNGHWILRRLELAHPDVWIRLGRPRLGLSNLSSARIGFSTFIWRGRFLAVADGFLSLLCSLAVLLELGAFAAFVLTFIR